MLRIVANKERLLTVRMAPQVLADFKLAVKLKGATMSALVHMYAFEIIREQRERNPEAFKKRADSDRPVVKAKLPERSKGKTRQYKR
jgi:hypothetical protein